MNEKTRKKITFVCTGNTCRSPMAEALLKSELKRLHIDGVEVCSAGMSAGKDSTVNLYSVKTLAENGLELINFRSTPLTERHFNDGIIICMTERQREQLVGVRFRLYHEGRISNKTNNVYSFYQLAGYEIPDPYGLTLDHYRYVYKKLAEGMQTIIDKFCQEKTVSKKRGRPKKSEQEKTSAPPKPPKTQKKKQAATDGVEPKKRGRPRKKPADGH